MKHYKNYETQNIKEDIDTDDPLFCMACPAPDDPGVCHAYIPKMRGSCEIEGYHPHPCEIRCDKKTGECTMNCDLQSNTYEQGKVFDKKIGKVVPVEPDWSCKLPKNKCNEKTGEVCNEKTGICEKVPKPDCRLKKCEPGKACDKTTGLCEPDCRLKKCEPGKACDKKTGICETVLEPDCRLPSIKCESGTVCDPKRGKCELNCNLPSNKCDSGKVCDKTTGLCEPSTLELDCRVVPCLLGSDCDTKTGKCVPKGTPDLNLCDNQKNFNHAFYKAIEYSRNRDEKKISPFLFAYLVIHFIFLVWGIVLAFKSQPPENRLVHITLSIVFAPAYVIAYYLNAF